MRRLNHDDGNVAIIVALAMTMLLGFAALSVDLGSALVRRAALQSGADAAALAIAQGCAEEEVYGTPTCTTAIAQGYFDDNAPGATPTVPPPTLEISHGGKVGRVTVTGSTTQQPYFAGALGAGSVNVGATATARWGPLTAADTVFPLVICKGALPPIGDPNPAELVISPEETDPPQCDGAPGEPPFGWITPDDPAFCEAKITLLPQIYMDVQPADQFPDNPGCQEVLEELSLSVSDQIVDHCTVKRGCHTHGPGNPEDRQRIVAVYDAAAGLSGSRPAYSLVQLEFRVIKLGTEEAVNPSGTMPTTCIDPAVSPPPPPGERQCFVAFVQQAIPDTDGPIYDPALAALPSIEDTTVLDVRLVD
jgi:Flp pilus assembly protein TadG